MNDDRTLERAARSFIEVGPTRAPEHAVDAALAPDRNDPTGTGSSDPVEVPHHDTPRTPRGARGRGCARACRCRPPGRRGRQGDHVGPAIEPGRHRRLDGALTIRRTVGRADEDTEPADRLRRLPGRLLVQHLGNAPDGSEADPVDGHFDRRRLYVMDPDGSNISELLPGQPATGKNMADVSPDHTKVVFQDWADAPKVYEVGLDGSGFRTLTDCDCSEGDPAYSPDGSQIVFNRLVGDVVTLGLRDLATGEVTMLPETAGTWDQKSPGEMPEHPSWSPDGRTIVYAMMRRASDGQLMSSRLLSLDLATRTVTDLGVAPELASGEPRYSPDGSLILFASRSAETSLGQAYGNIYTVHPDGTGLEQLTGARGLRAVRLRQRRDRRRAASTARAPRGPPTGCTSCSCATGSTSWTRTGTTSRAGMCAAPTCRRWTTGFGYTTYWIPDQP